MLGTFFAGNGGQSSVPYYIDNAANTNAACNSTTKLFRGQETYLPNAELCITYQARYPLLDPECLMKS